MEIINGNNAFARTAITSAVIPDGVTLIAGSTFSECQSLVYVVIPTSVERIEAYAFYCDYAFKTVFYKGTEEQWNSVDIVDGEYSWLSNGSLADATIRFYSESEPTETGNYWHYVNGVPTEW